MAYFRVYLDYKTPEHAGAGGMFQVISITDEDEKDHTHLVNQGTLYPSLASLSKGIAKALGIPPEDVDLEEVEEVN